MMITKSFVSKGMYKSTLTLCIATGLLIATPLALPMKASVANSNTSFEANLAGSPKPPTLHEISSKRYTGPLGEGEKVLPLDIRLDALKEAAVSYGARAGLSFRTHQIRADLKTRAAYLDKVFNFSQLLIPAPSGFTIEPPIISESLDAMIIEGDGQRAAVSDTIYNINKNAKFVSTARSWRQYLERDWGEVSDPPSILLPKNDEEISIWEAHTDMGWTEGYTQADEIFQEDLNTLIADYEGMIRYRKLLAQNIVSPPYALQTDRGITKETGEMRIGDRAVEITGKSVFISGAKEWQPVSR